MDSCSNDGKPAGADAFYVLQDPLSSTAFRAVPDPFESSLLSHQLGSVLPIGPIVFRHQMGRALREFVWSGLTPLVSDKVLEVFRSAGITGWSTYPVSLMDAEGVARDGYSGLVILGRCASVGVDKNHSQIVYRDYPRGRFPVLKGLWLNPSTWDGSDIFMGADGRTGWIIVVTDRVRKVVAQTKIRNCRLVPLEELVLSFGPEVFERRVNRA